MSTVTFSGLATGIDTASLIDQLMEIERLPLRRLENEKNYLNSRLSAFNTFDSKLESLLGAVEAMDTATELRSYSATPANEDYFTATASSTATSGTYQVKVVKLAYQEKHVATGWADQDTTTDTGNTLTINVGSDDPVNVTTTGLTLAEIAEAINDSDAHVSASIVNDGDPANPYRLVITADSAGEDITFGGDSDLTPTLSQTQQGVQSNIQVDGIDIYGDTNTFTDAIEGVTIEIDAESGATTTNLTVDVDKDAVKDKLEDFVDAYNAVISFIADQSDAGWGRDQGLTSAKRRIQNFLTTKIDGTGRYNYLSELGLETNQTTGLLSIDSTTMDDIINNYLDDVEKVVVGETGVTGIAEQFKEYLESVTDSIDGLYAARKDTTDSSVRWLDNRMTSMELRLEKKEESLRAQFSAMENLISALNSQSNYLAQQMSSLSMIGS